MLIIPQTSRSVLSTLACLADGHGGTWGEGNCGEIWAFERPGAQAITVCAPLSWAMARDIGGTGRALVQLASAYHLTIAVVPHRPEMNPFMPTRTASPGTAPVRTGLRLETGRRLKNFPYHCHPTDGFN
jgi:hypothetical protein